MTNLVSLCRIEYKSENHSFLKDHWNGPAPDNKTSNAHSLSYSVRRIQRTSQYFLFSLFAPPSNHFPHFILYMVDIYFSLLPSFCIVKRTASILAHCHARRPDGAQRLLPSRWLLLIVNNPIIPDLEPPLLQSEKRNSIAVQ